MKESDIATIESFKGLPVLTRSDSAYTYLISYLEKLYNVFVEASIKHDGKRSLFCKFDFTFPKMFNYVEDSFFSDFLAVFIKYLNSKSYRPLYIWVREQDKSVNPHFHLVLFIDGEKKWSPHDIHIYAAQLWCKHLNIPTVSGLIPEPRRHMIKWKQGFNPDNQSLAKAFQHGAYICKAKSKWLTPSYVNAIGHSMLTHTPGE